MSSVSFNKNRVSVHSLLSEILISLQLAIPLILSEWLYISSQFVSNWMAVKVNQNSLAALSIASSIYLLVLVIMLGISSSISIVISQCLGAKNEEGIRQTFAQGILASTLLALIASWILWMFPHFLPSWIKQNSEMMMSTTVLLHAFAWIMVPCSILIMMEKFFTGLYKARLVLFFTLLTAPLEIITNYGFVLGKWGLPRFGLAGFGYGFGITYTLISIIFFVLVCYMPSLKAYRFFSAFKRLDFRYFVEILIIGWPLGAMFGVEIAAMVVFTFMMSHFGAEVLDAYQIVRQYLGIGIASFFAIAETAAVRVGYSVGENNPKEIRRAFYVNLGIGIFLMALVGMVCIIFSAQFINLDINDSIDNSRPLIMFYAKQFLLAVVVFGFFDCMRIIASGALRGLKETKAIMYASIIGFWVIGLPLAYGFGHLTKLGAMGLWIGFGSGIGVSAFIVIYRFIVLTRSQNLKRLIQISSVQSDLKKSS